MKLIFKSSKRNNFNLNEDATTSSDYQAHQTLTSTSPNAAGIQSALLSSSEMDQQQPRFTAQNANTTSGVRADGNASSSCFGSNRNQRRVLLVFVVLPSFLCSLIFFVTSLLFHSVHFMYIVLAVINMSVNFSLAFGVANRAWSHVIPWVVMSSILELILLIRIGILMANVLSSVDAKIVQRISLLPVSLISPTAQVLIFVLIFVILGVMVMCVSAASIQWRRSQHISRECDQLTQKGQVGHEQQYNKKEYPLSDQGHPSRASANANCLLTEKDIHDSGFDEAVQRTKIGKVVQTLHLNNNEQMV